MNTNSREWVGMKNCAASASHGQQGFSAACKYPSDLSLSLCVLRDLRVQNPSAIIRAENYL
jgi:hypothetical protein